MYLPVGIFYHNIPAAENARAVITYHFQKTTKLIHVVKMPKRRSIFKSVPREQLISAKIVEAEIHKC